MSKIKVDIDIVCDMITNGDTWRDIAKALDMPLATLHDNTRRKPEHLGKIQLALLMSAEALADKALNTLLDLPKNATQAQITQAKELASHYRWLSAKRNPHVYSEKHAGNQDIVKSKKKLLQVHLHKDDLELIEKFSSKKERRVIDIPASDYTEIKNISGETPE